MAYTATSLRPGASAAADNGVDDKFGEPELSGKKKVPNKSDVMEGIDINAVNEVSVADGDKDVGGTATSLVAALAEAGLGDTTSEEKDVSSGGKSDEEVAAAEAEESKKERRKNLAKKMLHDNFRSSGKQIFGVNGPSKLDTTNFVRADSDEDTSSSGLADSGEKNQGILDYGTDFWRLPGGSWLDGEGHHDEVYENARVEEMMSQVEAPVNWFEMMTCEDSEGRLLVGWKQCGGQIIHMNMRVLKKMTAPGDRPEVYYSEEFDEFMDKLMEGRRIKIAGVDAVEHLASRFERDVTRLEHECLMALEAKVETSGVKDRVGGSIGTTSAGDATSCDFSKNELDVKRTEDSSELQAGEQAERQTDDDNEERRTGRGEAKSKEFDWRSILRPDRMGGWTSSPESVCSVGSSSSGQGSRPRWRGLTRSNSSMWEDTNMSPISRCNLRSPEWKRLETERTVARLRSGDFGGGYLPKHPLHDHSGPADGCKEKDSEKDEEPENDLFVRKEYRPDGTYEVGLWKRFKDGKEERYKPEEEKKIKDNFESLWEKERKLEKETGAREDRDRVRYGNKGKPAMGMTSLKKAGQAVAVAGKKKAALKKGSKTSSRTATPKSTPKRKGQCKVQVKVRKTPQEKQKAKDLREQLKEDMQIMNADDLMVTVRVAYRRLIEERDRDAKEFAQEMIDKDGKDKENAEDENPLSSLKTRRTGSGNEGEESGEEKKFDYGQRVWGGDVDEATDNQPLCPYPASEMFQVFVKGPEVKATLKIHPKMCIQEVMYELEKKEAIPMGFQKLRKGKVWLEIDKYITDYGIEREDVLYLEMSLLGGAPAGTMESPAKPTGRSPGRPKGSGNKDRGKGKAKGRAGGEQQKGGETKHFAMHTPGGTAIDTDAETERMAKRESIKEEFAHDPMMRQMWEIQQKKLKEMRDRESQSRPQESCDTDISEVKEGYKGKVIKLRRRAKDTNRDAGKDGVRTKNGKTTASQKSVVQLLRKDTSEGVGSQAEDAMDMQAMALSQVSNASDAAGMGDMELDDESEDEDEAFLASQMSQMPMELPYEVSRVPLEFCGRKGAREINVQAELISNCHGDEVDESEILMRIEAHERKVIEFIRRCREEDAEEEVEEKDEPVDLDPTQEQQREVNGDKKNAPESKPAAEELDNKENSGPGKGNRWRPGQKPDDIKSEQADGKAEEKTEDEKKVHEPEASEPKVYYPAEPSGNGENAGVKEERQEKSPGDKTPKAKKSRFQRSPLAAVRADKKDEKDESMSPGRTPGREDDEAALLGGRQGLDRTADRVKGGFDLYGQQYFGSGEHQEHGYWQGGGGGQGKGSGKKGMMMMAPPLMVPPPGMDMLYPGSNLPPPPPYAGDSNPVAAMLLEIKDMLKTDKAENKREREKDREENQNKWKEVAELKKEINQMPQRLEERIDSKVKESVKATVETLVKENLKKENPQIAKLSEEMVEMRQSARIYRNAIMTAQKKDVANRARLFGIGNMLNETELLQSSLSEHLRKATKCEVWRKKLVGEAHGAMVGPGIADLWFVDGKAKTEFLKAWKSAKPTLTIDGKEQKVFANPVSTPLGEVQDKGLKDMYRQVKQTYKGDPKSLRINWAERSVEILEFRVASQDLETLKTTMCIKIEDCANENIARLAATRAAAEREQAKKEGKE